MRMLSLVMAALVAGSLVAEARQRSSGPPMLEAPKGTGAISGVVTDQCIESAVRDACDLGYLVTVVTDACATYTRERHEFALKSIKGYCRQRTTDEFLAEIAKPS